MFQGGKEPYCRSRDVRQSHNQLIGLDVKTRARRGPGVGIVHRSRARLHNECPQLSKLPTPIVKIREAIPAQESDEIK